MAITQLSQLDLSATYTYRDYLSWQLQERLELLRGKIALMSPAPNLRHQRISGNLHGILWQYFDQVPCQLFSAPFDVRLTRQEQADHEPIYTVVQPDLCVVCDPTKLDERGCLGAPDLVVEILSPGNSRREMREKFELYEEAGVRTYWIVDPEHSTVQRFVLNETGIFIGLRPLTDEDQLTSELFPGLAVELKKVFAEP